MGATRRSLAAALLGLACGPQLGADRAGPLADWPVYAGDAGGLAWSPLTQIHRGNVADLELAWSHRSGDFSRGGGGVGATAFQVTPIVANGALYYCTPFMRVFALDPETGAERWSFDPGLRGRSGEGPYPLTCRGVAYWQDPDPAAGGACARRILYGTRDSELIALDADTGRPCAGFGRGGRVSLREGIGDAAWWEYYPTSPPLVIGDLAVIGALVADSLRVDAPSGVVRAFDVRSGARVWAWDPVPPGWQPPPGPGPRYRSGTPNVWSLLSGDPERQLVFVPTGNASPDSYGGERRGLDYYASSTVALDAATGSAVWRFQTVHHDLWDYDVASQPALFQIPGVAGGAAAVAQATKMGHVFLLDRETGRPLYPVEERPVPGGGVAGEWLSPTQPFPTHPPPLHPTELAPFGFTPFDRRACAEQIARYRYEGIFTPPSLEGSIQMPHTAGGINWGGVAIDPTSGTLFANQTHAALVTQLIPRDEVAKLDPGALVYPNEFYPMRGTPYGVRRFLLASSLGAPCNPPPWGTLQAVDLRSGSVRWKVPLGTTRDQAPFPLWLGLGVPNFGGPIATAGGLVFVGATTDRYFRAFDADSGDELWRERIPYTGNAKPMSYRLRPGGRQYVVLAAGGNPLTEPGDALLAFALPE